VYDSLGTASTIQIDWKKTADNAWTASFEQPKLASAPTTASANPITDTVAITFNADGSLNSTVPSPPTISVTGWT
uniref:flagellar basal body FlgE domain-containing protein n=2 Tax=Pseudomonadota TaxID=1224 RepID=UPI0023B7C39E